MFKEAKIYVAGHRGLLGSALVRRLRAGGWKRLVVRTHRQLDLTDVAKVDHFFRQEAPEVVFLAAGLTGGIHAMKTEPATFMSVNLAIQNNVFAAAHRHRVKKLVFYASSCIYPMASASPIREEYLLSGKPERTSEAYALAKISGIKACQAYNEQYRKKTFIALVPNSMYGPGDNFDLLTSHVLSGLIRKLHDAKIQKKDRIALWGSGEPRREFIFSDDVADASVFAVEHAEKLDNTHYNIGTQTDIAINVLAKLIARVVGFKGAMVWDTSKPDGARRKLLDSHRFYALGWKPSVGLEEGIRRTYEWFLNKA